MNKASVDVVLHPKENQDPLRQISYNTDEWVRARTHEYPFPTCRAHSVAGSGASSSRVCCHARPACVVEVNSPSNVLLPLTSPKTPLPLATFPLFPGASAPQRACDPNDMTGILPERLKSQMETFGQRVVVPAMRMQACPARRRPRHSPCLARAFARLVLCHSSSRLSCPLPSIAAPPLPLC